MRSLTAPRRSSLDGNPLHLTAALCQSGALPGIERHFSESVLDYADRHYRGMSIQELLLRAAGFQTWARSGTLPNLLRAAFSSIELPKILSDVANKFLLAGFDHVESAWREIAAVRNVPNFKPVTSYRLTGAGKYEKIAPHGEIKHGTLDEEGYENQADTYGRMLTISRTAIINDDLSALTAIPKALGRGAALTMNDVFWGVFLNQANFFSAANGNRLDGPDTALNIDGLTKAETAFYDMVDKDGAPLGINPAIMLVPTPLNVPASQLMSSLEIRQNDGDGSYPVSNPHQGKFRVVRSSYLTKLASPAASDKAWYLLADPADLPVIEIAALHGQLTPTIESADADFNILGIAMRGFHDFGVNLQDPRGGLRMDGE